MKRNIIISSGIAFVFCTLTAFAQTEQHYFRLTSGSNTQFLSVQDTGYVS